MLWTDKAFQAVMDKIITSGAADNTIFIFSVDHNTENGKATCYETGVKIPFMITWPGIIQKGTVINSLTQNIDLLPTLLDAAGIQNTDKYPVDGKSMLPLFKDNKNEIHDDLFFEFGYSRAVKAGHWKYIAVRYTREIYEKLADGTMKEVPNLSNMPEQGQAKINIHAFENCLEPDQLYNLSTDPLEQNNLAELPEYKEKLQEMKQRLKKYTDSFIHPFPETPHPFHKSRKFRQLLEKTKKNHPAETIPWYNKDKTIQRGWPLDFKSLLKKNKFNDSE
jgi:arylsulfatase A-like enzyme